MLCLRVCAEDKVEEAGGRGAARKQGQIPNEGVLYAVTRQRYAWNQHSHAVAFCPVVSVGWVFFVP